MARTCIALFELCRREEAEEDFAAHAASVDSTRWPGPVTRFFLGSLVGIVLAGRAADRRGTRLPLALGLALFAPRLGVGGAGRGGAA